MLPFSCDQITRANPAAAPGRRKSFGEIVMAKHPPIILTPFFRPRDEGAAEPRMYVAGFADEAGETWGTLIPLDAEMVEHAVLGLQTFTSGATPTVASNRSRAATVCLKSSWRKANWRRRLSMSSSPKPSSRARMNPMMTSSICSRPCMNGWCGRRAWSPTRSRGEAMTLRGARARLSAVGPACTNASTATAGGRHPGRSMKT
ncbi:hypothetical protein ABIA94_008539 [Bradyrhizobium sp. LA7.1]